MALCIELHNSDCRATVCSPDVLRYAGQPSDQAKEVRKACMLNICSCQLNLGQFDLCAKECTEVLSTDVSNRKALYRRGQAYNGLARYQLLFLVLFCSAGASVLRCMLSFTCMYG